MSYNLRTGLTGSGDVDINVSLSDLDAANITSGEFDSDRIPILGDAKLSALSATKLTGTIQSDQIQSLQGNKITGDASIPVSVLPALSTSQITSGTAFPTSFIPDLSADKIVSEELHIDRIPNIPTSKLTGTVASANLDLTTDDVPELPKSKISTAGQWVVTDLPTIPKYLVSTAETWALTDIPNLPTSKITSGTFDTARIPDLSALKITTDTLNSARIPNLDASKITTGTIDSDRLPSISTHDLLDYNAINGDFLTTSVGNSWTTVHDDLRSNNVAQVPPSAMIEVEFSFLYSSLSSANHTLLAQLVDGGTNYEYVSQVINNNNLTYSTANTYVAQGVSTNANGYATVKWTIKYASSAVGDDIDMEPQLKVIPSGLTIAINSGLNTTSNVNFPSTIFKITALPSSSTLTNYAAPAGGQ